MSHSFKKILIALSLLPVISLIGCNKTPTSPPPGVMSMSYQDYTATYVKEETSGEDVLTTFHIKNTGDHYLAGIGIFEDNDEGRLYGSSNGFNTPFKSAVLPPNYEKDVSFKTERAYSDKENLTIVADAYNRGGAASIKGEPVLANLSGERCYVRGIEIMGSLMMKRPTTLYYGVIIEVTYDGERYYFACDEDHDFTFSTYYKLDSSKVTDVRVAGIISSDKPTSSSDFMYAALIIIVGVLLASFMVAPIFLAILIPLIIIRKRRKNAAK